MLAGIHWSRKCFGFASSILPRPCEVAPPVELLRENVVLVRLGRLHSHSWAKPSRPFGVATRAVKELLGELGTCHQEFSMHTNVTSVCFLPRDLQMLGGKGLVKLLQRKRQRERGQPWASFKSSFSGWESVKKLTKGIMWNTARLKVLYGTQ